MTSADGSTVEAPVEPLVRMFVLVCDYGAGPIPSPTATERDLVASDAKRRALLAALSECGTALDQVPTMAEGDWRSLGPGQALYELLGQALSACGPLEPEAVISLLIDSAQAVRWPKGVHWTEGQGVDGYLVLAAAELAPHADIDVVDVLKRHERANARLRKDSMSPAMQASVGVLIGVGFAVSGGAANAIGTMVGIHVLGLSGAAATSAGLAALGGGSLAAGGLGVAGGTVVASVVFLSVKTAGQKVMLGVAIAQESPQLFVHELAKMDVACQLGMITAPDLVSSLRDLQEQLIDQLNSIPEREGRVARVTDGTKQAAGAVMQALQASVLGKVQSGGDLVQQGKAIWDELPTKDERNLAASIRATEFEIRHLTSPIWKRRVAVVPRFMGVPAVSRLLDRFE